MKLETPFSRAHHLPLSWVRSVQPTSSKLICWRHILLLSSDLRLDLPSDLFQGSLQNPVCVSSLSLPYVPHAPPILFCLIWPLGRYLVRSTSREPPHCVVHTCRTYIILFFAVSNVISSYRGAGKSLARPGRKQANVSVRMTWISFGTLPCRGKKNLMTARVSTLLKSRASLTCFRACFLPGRAKDLSAPRYIDFEDGDEFWSYWPPQFSLMQCGI